MNYDELPVAPHSGLPGDDPECCGCLSTKERGTDADLICNGCGAVVGTVPIHEVPQTLLRLAMDQGMCSAICDHYGAFNVILGFSSVDAFTCRECGEGVTTDRPIQ